MTTTHPTARGPFGRAPDDPQAVVLVEGAREVTFAELAVLSDAVGRSLYDHDLRGRVVGVSADRSADFVARMVGAWNVGAVPAVIGETERGRRRRALVAAGAAASLGQGEPELLDVRLDGAPVDATQASHVLFTSGTTGRPKGVVVGRAAFEAASAAFFDRLPVGEADRIAFLSRPGHDPSLRELVAPWLTGATLVVPDPFTASDPGQTAEWLARCSVTVLQASPVQLQLLAASSPRPVESLRLVCSVGARLTAAALEAARRFAPHATVANCYGASETPQVVCLHTMPPGAPASDPVPIGEPLAHASVMVAPTGTPGEGVLHVEASACALGYTDRTPLVAPDADGRLWYDTGDVVRLRPDGALCYVGRRDRQVQVNGTRVELEEVEAAAREVPGVVGADATLVEDGRGVGSVRLTVTPEPSTGVDVDQLATVLRDVLDPAAVPSIAVRDDAAPAISATSDEQGPGADREALMDVLRASAAAALGRGGIDTEAGFFEVGFSSMTLMHFVSEASVRLGREISPVAAFLHPNLSALADHLSESPDD